MKLSVKGMSITLAIVWGAAMLLVNTINYLNPEYGLEFLKVIASIYPGYEPQQGITSIAIGTLYGIVDAAIAGAIIAWVYNWVVGHKIIFNDLIIYKYFYIYQPC